MRTTSLALLTTAALGLAATAQADLIWDWSFTGGEDPNVGSPHLEASGTLTTDPLSDGAYVITGISGTYVTYPNHSGTLTTYSITGLDSAYAFHNPPPDNTLYTPGYNGSSPADNLLLSTHGLSFFFGPAGGPASSYANIYDNPGTGVYYVRDSTRSQDGGIFTATLVPSPEPSQMISMLSLAGIGGAAFLFNLRRRK